MLWSVRLMSWQCLSGTLCQANMAPVLRLQFSGNPGDHGDVNGTTVATSTRSAAVYDEPYGSHMDDYWLFMPFMAPDWAQQKPLDKDAILRRLHQPRPDMSPTSAEVIEEFNNFCHDFSRSTNKDTMTHIIMPYLAVRNGHRHIFRAFNVWQNNLMALISTRPHFPKPDLYDSAEQLDVELPVHEDLGRLIQPSAL